MSGGLKKFTKTVKTALNPAKAFKESLNPKKAFKNSLGIIDDLTGATAAEDQAAALQAQTRAQQEASNKALRIQQAQDQLNSQGDLDNVATVTAGGTAASADEGLSTTSKKNRKSLISSTLGLS
ncbi:hypothetical protein [Erwinia phage Zoomie]|uniref:Uncharacterized protein n=1 Tax=Erwinia phage Zoomie TaxID=2851072 RepID=A0A9E6T3H7_9CAUD|nr:hypothetical protein [Erwinia phage Zoomie]